MRSFAQTKTFQMVFSMRSERKTRNFFFSTLNLIVYADYILIILEDAEKQLNNIFVAKNDFNIEGNNCNMENATMAENFHQPITALFLKKRFPEKIIELVHLKYQFTVVHQPTLSVKRKQQKKCL